ncbi:hypothetical protein AB1Y20_020661 [Prymnesium parvum]|uniref:Uncharacterized protein n=1 Tax=Prymnesium parvum TaxID=97485 RepID=A0AB34JXU8_PRYPA
MPEPDGKYRGPFCTGHTFFPMTAVNFYTETLNHEFREEYKQAHGMKTPMVRLTGIPSPERRKPPVELPLAGTPTSATLIGGRLPRKEIVSSNTIGGWWSDPHFAKASVAENTAISITKPPGHGKATSTDIGSYWHDERLTAADAHADALRLKNGVKRVYQEETLSRFTLEALPIEHRLL